MTQETTKTTTEIFCPNCGYNLRGLDSERCPECGLAIDWANLSVSRIPWLHRRWIGFMPALWRTVWMVIRRPAMVAAERGKPVSLSQAQRFRWVIVFVACLVAWAYAIILRSMADPTVPLPGLELLMPGGMTGPNRPDAVEDVLLCFWAGALLWPVPIVAIFLCFAGVTGVASYWFHPRSLPVIRQNRAIALSYYACAPLAMLIFEGIAVGGWWGLHALAAQSPPAAAGWMPALAGVACIAMGAAIVLSWWWSTLRIMTGTTDCSANRLVAAGIILPVIWGILLLLTCFVLPVMIGLIWWMFQSYWG